VPAARAQTLAVNDATYVAWNAHDADGLVVEDVHFTDMAGLMAQLGVT